MKGDGGDEWLECVMRKNHALGKPRLASRSVCRCLCSTHALQSPVPVHVNVALTRCLVRGVNLPSTRRLARDAWVLPLRPASLAFHASAHGFVVRAALRLMEVREAYLEEFQWQKVAEIAGHETREANTRLMRAAAMASLQASLSEPLGSSSGAILGEDLDAPPLSPPRAT